tara:strand:- start:2944 stop:3150 length:207 start_codon:yes stop_codon:yes gene_type:complete
MKTILYFLLVSFLFTNNTYAYLDPGTGSIILQAIIAGITAFFTTIIFYYRKVKKFLKSLFKKKDEKKY